MCILFMYVANQVKGASVVSPYKLIIASNRDEKFSRPTKPAYFWEDPQDSHILAGQDLEELGTWLGISKHGKLAILLNIMGSIVGSNETTNVSRGSLVTGFLRSPPGLPGCTYLKNLCHLDISGVYKPFHLITIDLLGCNTDEAEESIAECKCKHSANTASPKAVPTNKSSICVNYLANSGKQTGAAVQCRSVCTSNHTVEPKHMTPPANTCKYYAFGNSMIDKPFKKVELGRVEFQKIVARHLERSDKQCSNSLVDDLLQFLKCTEKHFPDEVLSEQAKGTKIPEGLLPHFSSRMLNIPGADYGTRTHTIVLVDMQNNVTFHEWTMTPPIIPTNPQWTHSQFTFSLCPVN